MSGKAFYYTIFYNKKVLLLIKMSILWLEDNFYKDYTIIFLNSFSCLSFIVYCIFYKFETSLRKPPSKIKSNARYINPLQNFQ
jgi:hypothetical protein